MLDLDPITLRSYALCVLYTLVAGVAAGLAPAWMRTAARKTDPSIAAALFGTVLSGAAAGYAFYSGAFSDGKIAAVTAGDAPMLALAALLTAILWLSLFTALTGGLVSKVMPVVNASCILVLVANAFSGKAVLGVYQLSAVVLVLLGTVMIESRTKSLEGQLWFFYAIAAAVALTFVTVLGSTHFRTANTGWYLFWRTAPAALLLWIFALARGKFATFRTTPKRAFLLLPLSALAIGICKLLTLAANARSFGTVTIPVAAVGFFFMIFFARTIRKEKQPGSAVFGMLLILGGMLVIANGW